MILYVKGRSLADDWLHNYSARVQFTKPWTRFPQWRFADGSVIEHGTSEWECPFTAAEPAGERADMIVLRRARCHARKRAIRVAWQKLWRGLAIK